MSDPNDNDDSQDSPALTEGGESPQHLASDDNVDHDEMDDLAREWKAALDGAEPTRLKQEYESARPPDGIVKEILDAHHHWNQSGGRDGEKADFTGMHLSNMDFQNLDLEGVSFREADLTDANLGNSNLCSADFFGAELRRANLAGCDLRYARFPAASCMVADFSNTDLSNAVLNTFSIHEYANGYEDFSVASFVGATLREIDIRSRQMGSADFARANITGIHFSDIELSSSEFFDAKLSNCDFHGVDFSNTSFMEATLKEVYFHSCDLSGARFFQASLDGVVFNDCNLHGAHFETANFDDVSITKCFLTDLNLSPLINAKVRISQMTGPCIVDHTTIAKSLSCEGLEDFLVAIGLPQKYASYALDTMRSMDRNGLFNLMHSTFISYGGPDEEMATRIYHSLNAAGVRTYLFKKHAIFGRSLSHTMRSGVRDFDRIILLCSENSLTRPGVQNEIELSLQREAAEGGKMLLVPIALDRFVFDDWSPQNPDHKEAIMRRVIGDFVGSETDQNKYRDGIRRLLEALIVE